MQKNKIKHILMAILGLSSVILIAALIKLNSIPTKYLLILLGLLLLVNVAIAALLYKTKFLKVNSVIIVLISSALIFASFNLFKTEGFLSKVTGGKFDIHLVSAIVLKESSIEAIEDLGRQDLAINTEIDPEFVNETIEKINASFDKELVVKDYESNAELVEALYSGKEIVILISESQRSFIEDQFDTFSDDTKIVFQHGSEVPIDFGTYSRDVDVLKDTYTIFISGIDTDGPVNTVSRSDVNMLMTVNPRTHQILLTSLPRDTHVKLATKDGMDKLTSAGAYGIDESVLTLENFFNIEIDYYLKVNFSSVERIVDALGGLAVDSQFEFRSGKLYFTKGINYLNGEQTLRFVRERKNLEKGDDHRILNQQAVVKALLNKVMSPSVLLNYSSFLSSIEGSFVINMEDNQLKSIIKDQIDNMNSWDIIDNAIFGVGTYSLDTYSAKGISAFVDNADPESVEHARELIISMNGEKRISLD